MFLRSAKIRNFRNLREVDLDLSGGNAAFLGLNGAGKTNLIEAIYFGLKGRPFRPFVQKTDLFRQGTNERTSVELFVHQEGGRNSEIQVFGNPETNRFSFHVNDKKMP